MSAIGHNRWPEIDDFQVIPLKTEPKLAAKILEFVSKVSNWVYDVIVPQVYIDRWDALLFQIKPDAFVTFEWNAESFRVTWIEECVPSGFYEKKAA